MLHRRLAPPLALVLIAGLTACSPAPSPDPTPTYRQFASEEEAFEAAEETLKEYAAANNQVVLSEPRTFEAVYAWTAGEEAANIREDLTTLAAQGLTLSGETSYLNFRGVEYDAAAGRVLAIVCVDTSKTGLSNARGESVLPPDRETSVSSDLIFARQGTSTGLAVLNVNRNSENGACAL